ncbi:hypothetical protein [Nocardia sp. CS682]|nr:hypothetical protein [Nocardia sp. CS682]
MLFEVDTTARSTRWRCDVPFVGDTVLAPSAQARQVAERADFGYLRSLG